MRVGSKWGWLTCLEVSGGWAEDGGGAVREWIREKEYRLGCRCGREVVVQAQEFKGKRGMRSCGMEGCTYPALGGTLESTWTATQAGASQAEAAVGGHPPAQASAQACHAGAASMGAGTGQASMGVGAATTPQPFHTRLGRPPIYKSRCGVVNYYLPDELSDWVKVYAAQKGTSASAVAARALAELRERATQERESVREEGAREEGVRNE